LKKFSIFLSIFILYVIICMVVQPTIYMQEALNGFKAWALNVLPCVLPFIFLTKILSSLGHVQSFAKIFSKPISRFFNCPPHASFVFFMSIISGYPVGAKMTADLYLSGQISKAQAYRMTSFCSTSGPMFIIGAVGAGMLKSSLFGYVIFIAHVLGAIINGFLYKNLKAKEEDVKMYSNSPQKQPLSIGDIVNDSALSIIAVGTIIAIFFVFIRSLAPFFNLFPASIVGTLEGLIEITKGCLDIASILPLKLATLACTFVISFGGLSTILQSLTMLNKLKMPVGLFILQKITHAIFATIVCGFILLFI